ncbi:copper amine oxidase N-terminal domain-containing protein [Geosporobacter ferrireducens]|uniref:copper amine oxidase N-terminal domain-containing protein n=1 Tax=Geosporobacter ferrireducens TaxID=1424294 RepID=UPI0023557FFB|nr:stalk domain-containing protein [Geosporobacter ferrireducens]
MFGKKLISFFMVSLLSLMGFIMPVDAYDKINVKVDNISLVFEDQDPIIIDGRTLVPMRKIFETLGATIDWDGTTSTVTAVKEDIKIVIKIGADTAKVNGKDIILDVPAQILNGRTMVPLRFVSEAMGAEVSWEGSTRTVVISTGQDSGKMSVPPEGANTRTSEQQREGLKNKIQSFVDNGTITQEQAEKIFDAFSGPSGIMLTPNALNALVEQGVITQEQAEAVMKAVKIGGR